MIVTLTPNPSIDRTLEVDELVRGGVVRATRVHVEAGGKGVNVARALDFNGVDTVAVIPAGGSDGAQLIQILTEDGLAVRSVLCSGSTRVNVTLVEPSGTVTKVNAPGPTLSPAELTELVDLGVGLAREGQWLVASGSLPPGVSRDLYADLVERSRGEPYAVAIDAAGDPLAAAVSASPDLIKPNVHELAELAGVRLHTLGDVLAAAEQIRAGGVAQVLVSLGADGALLVGEETAWARPEPVTPRSNVGAGDATLAGFLAAGAAGAEALRMAVAFGSAAVQLPGTAMPGPTEIGSVRVHLEPIDPTRPLQEEGGART